MRLKVILLSVLCLALWNAPFSQAAKYEIKFGHDHKETSPHHKAALWVKEKLERESNGEIAVTIFPSQMLGTGIQMVEMLQAGAIQLLAVPTSNVQVIQPGLQVLGLPFLFPDQETLYEKLGGDLGKALFTPLEEKNIIGLTFWESGFKCFTSNFPINVPGDMKGNKFRIMPSPVIREQFLALGANPVPIDFQELYNALQQGVVDGQENPLMTIVTMKFFEVQDYVTLSNHAWLGYAVMANKGFLENLPENLRQLVVETIKDSQKVEVELANNEQKKYLKTIKDSGTKVIELTPEQSDAFREAVTPVYNWFSNNVENGQKYIDLAR